MNKLSLENPYVPSIFLLLIGLIGFTVVQINVNMMNTFSIIFLLLSFLLLFFVIRWAYYLELKRKWVIKPINSFIGYSIIFFKLFLLFLFLNSGGSSTFDGRLEVYGSSMLVGIDMALTIMIFPLLPLLASSIIVRRTSFCIFIISILSGLLLAPSKSIFIALIFHILLYKFLYNKIHGIDTNYKLFSYKSFLIFLTMLVLTLSLIFFKHGFNGFSIIVHRIAYNFDIAIYASMIPFHKTPEHSNLFYAIFPLLKQIFPYWNNIEFNKIPQWILEEALDINTAGRYGYPNDNFIVGILVSFKYFGIIIFGIFIFAADAYVKHILCKNKITVFSLYILLFMPLFFISTQDFSIKILVFSCIVVPLLFLHMILPKLKKEKNANNLR